MMYPVLIDDINDDDELPVLLAIVNQGHPPNLDVPLERLHPESYAHELKDDKMEKKRNSDWMARNLKKVRR